MSVDIILDRLFIEGTTEYPTNERGPSALVHAPGVDGCVFEVYDGFSSEGAQETAEHIIRMIKLGLQLEGLPDLLGMVVGLYSALEERNDCGNCGGSGTTWVAVDEEAEPEPCQCWLQARFLVEHYRDGYMQVVDAYLRREGFDPDEIERECERLAAEMLERVRERVEQRES